MSDLTVKVTADVSDAKRNLDNLNKSVEKLNNSFGAMKAAIAGLVSASSYTSILKYADAISDLSDATNISIGAITAFGKAAMVSGGEVDSANTGLLKFTQTVGEAAEGSKQAQLALEEVGITLTDLKSLSEEDLLKKTMSGLAGMEDATKRMAAQVALFGKGARGINFGNMAGAFDEAAAGSAKYAASIKAGADAQQALEVNLKNLTTALLEVLKPLNELIGNINVSVEAFKSLISIVAYAGGAYLIFAKGIGALNTATTALILGVKSAGGVLAFFGTQLMGILAAPYYALLNLGRAIGVVAGAGGLASLIAALSAVARGFLRFAGVVGIVMSVAEAVNFLSKQLFNFDILDWVYNNFVKLYDIAKKFFGIKSEGPDQSDAETKRLKEKNDAIEKQKAAVSETTDAWAKQRKELELVSQAFKKQNTDIIRNLGVEKEILGKSKEYVDVLKAQDEIANRAADEIKKLQDAKSMLSKEDKKLAPLYDQQIAKIQQIAVIDTERVAEQVKGLNKLQQAEQIRLFGIQQQIELNKQLQSVQDDLAKMTMTDIEKKYYDIEAAAKASARAAIDAEEARRGAKLSAEEEQKYYDIALAGTDRLKQSQQKLYESSRTFSVGWTQAFNEYMDSATNAANRAKDIFSAVTSSMNNAIDNFVETGKFSFNDFASSVIKDLIKIELKAATMNLWKSMGGGGGGGGGLLSSLGGMLGFAGGGNPPIGKASIVGENGPELIVPRTASTVIPNGAGNGQVSNTYITNNISALDAKSVQQLFAENRRALLGSVEAAKREMPGRR